MRVGVARELYVDRVYLPVYDATVARLAPYQRLQREGVARLAVAAGDDVLVVGAGTGWEVEGLTGGGWPQPKRIVAVDVATQGLRRTLRRARATRCPIHVVQMDAQRLALPPEVFDRVICMHTMDFVPEPEAATREMVRVLRRGGAFVITYPTGKGSSSLAGEVARSAWDSARQGHVLSGARQVVAGVGAALAYAPIALAPAPARHFHSRDSIAALMASVGISQFAVTEERTYQDLIVWGRR